MRRTQLTIRAAILVGVAGSLTAACLVAPADSSVKALAVARRAHTAHIGESRAADPPSSTPIYLNRSYSFAERAADLVSRMTLAQKASQMKSSYSPAIPSLGVRSGAGGTKRCMGSRANSCSTMPTPRR